MYLVMDDVLSAEVQAKVVCIIVFDLDKSFTIVFVWSISHLYIEIGHWLSNENVYDHIILHNADICLGLVAAFRPVHNSNKWHSSLGDPYTINGYKKNVVIYSWFAVTETNKHHGMACWSANIFHIEILLGVRMCISLNNELQDQ